MTRVQRHFTLSRPLDESLMNGIADVNSIYGIEQIRISPSRDELMVEFDATRMNATQVEMALRRAGLPVTVA